MIFLLKMVIQFGKIASLRLSPRQNHLLGGMANTPSPAVWGRALWWAMGGSLGREEGERGAENVRGREGVWWAGVGREKRKGKEVILAPNLLSLISIHPLPRPLLLWVSGII